MKPSLPLILIVIILFSFWLDAARANENSRILFPLDCFSPALELGLTVHQSVLLCTNAKSMEPVRCFKKIQDPLTPDQRINLCSGVTSNGPADCYQESEDLPLSFDQRIKLCGGAGYLTSSPDNFEHSDRSEHSEHWQTAPVDCFKKALRLPLSQDQRVILCSCADSDKPIHCFDRSEMLNITLDQRVRLCTQLSPSSW